VQGNGADHYTRTVDYGGFTGFSFGKVRKIVTGTAEPAHREAVAEYFDATFYTASNPDIGGFGGDALDHFLVQGWKEGRNPSRTFDVAHYLKRNPDVAQAGINPLLHYAWAGKREGRSPRRPLDAVRRRLETSASPSAQAIHWGGAADTSTPLPLDELLRVLDDKTGREGTVLSVSHDDYKANFGGIQRLVNDEQVAFVRAGWTYLHCSPAAPLPIMAAPADPENFRLRLRANGDFVGVVTAHDLCRWLSRTHDRLGRVAFIIHHFLGHVPEHLALFASVLSVRPIVWVHDFFTICPSYALMRNDITYCGAPPLGSQSCAICTYGEDRNTQSPRIVKFFADTRPTVLAPSDSTLEIWQRRSQLLHHDIHVVPLARVITARSDAQAASVEEYGDRPLRVAHIGHRSLFKGWTVFEELALSLAKDERYAFYQFGVDNGVPPPGCIRPVQVRVTGDSKEAMIEALVERGIDLVISWSLWPETFCFAIHEAIASGAYIVANGQSGNVWPAVAKNAPGRGYCVQNEAQLQDLFVSGEIVRLVRGRQKLRGAVICGRGTADWLVPNWRPDPSAVPQEDHPRSARRNISMFEPEAMP
jgi:hypothetical protein